MTNWRDDLRSQGFHIDDVPDPVPPVPRGRCEALARWTVAWKRETTAIDGAFRETIRLPDGYEWAPSTREGVHADRQYMTREVDAPAHTEWNTIFKSHGEHYMHPYFFERNKWIVKV